MIDGANQFRETMVFREYGRLGVNQGRPITRPCESATARMANKELH